MDPSRPFSGRWLLLRFLLFDSPEYSGFVFLHSFFHAKDVLCMFGVAFGHVVGDGEGVVDVLFSLGQCKGRMEFSFEEERMEFRRHVRLSEVSVDFFDEGGRFLGGHEVGLYFVAEGGLFLLPVFCGDKARDVVFVQFEQAVEQGFVIVAVIFGDGGVEFGQSLDAGIARQFFCGSKGGVEFAVLSECGFQGVFHGFVVGAAAETGGDVARRIHDEDAGDASLIVRVVDFAVFFVKLWSVFFISCQVDFDEDVVFAGVGFEFFGSGYVFAQFHTGLAPVRAGEFDEYGFVFRRSLFFSCINVGEPCVGRESGSNACDQGGGYEWMSHAKQSDGCPTACQCRICPAIC